MHFQLPQKEIVRLYQGDWEQEKPQVPPHIQKPNAFKSPHILPDTPLSPSHVQARAAALQLQDAFLQWQSEAKKKKAQAGLQTQREYHHWYEQAYASALQELASIDLQEQKTFQIWAQEQHALYEAWAKQYTLKQEYAFALKVHTSVLRSCKHMLRTNLSQEGMVRQALEHILESTHALAQLQGMPKAKAQKMTRAALRTCLYPALLEHIQRAELDTALQVLQQHQKLLSRKERQVIRQKIKKRTHKSTKTLQK